MCINFAAELPRTKDSTYSIKEYHQDQLKEAKHKSHSRLKTD